MSLITTYCHLSGDACTLNGDVVARRDKDSEDGWLKQIYKQQEFAYPKFYKMDVLSQAGYLASQLIKRANPRMASGYQDDEIAMVFANQASSADTDLRFLRSYADHSAPSPSLFVYTLPNIVLGEIAIANKWYGENMFAVLPTFTPGFFVDYGRILLSQNTKAMLCGWIEILEAHMQVFLFFVEKNAENGIDFNQDNLLELSNFNL